MRKRKYKNWRKTINPLTNECQESQERKKLVKENKTIQYLKIMEIGAIKKTRAENSGNGNAS